MTTVAVPASPVLGPVDRPIVGRGRIFVDSLRFEWTKLRTVRSTWWTLLAGVTAMLGIATLVSEITVHQWATTTPANRLLFDPLETSVSGAFFAQLAMGVLGVLVITTEYGTGMIRNSFAAVPQRGTLLAAKSVVLFGVTLAVGIMASFAAFFTTQTILSTNSEANLGVSITDPGALPTVLGAGLFLALIGLLGCAVGAVLRRSAGAITTLFGFTFLLPVLMQLLPAAIKNNVTKYLPSEAGAAIFRQIQQPDALTPSAGLVVLGSYALVGLAVATVILRHRDA
jgi:ABC-2 type transport system permease protein